MRDEVNHIIFDMDGVLYQITDAFNNALWSVALIPALIDFGVPLSEDEISALAKESFARTGSSSDYFIKHYGIDYYELMSKAHTHVPVDDHIKPDVKLRGNLIALADQGISLSVLTAADRVYAGRVLNAIGIADIFNKQHITCIDDYRGHSKGSDAKPFDLALERANARPKNSIMVEDTARNLEIPFKMGFKDTVYLTSTHGHQSHEWVRSTYGTVHHFLDKFSP